MAEFGMKDVFSATGVVEAMLQELQKLTASDPRVLIAVDGFNAWTEPRYPTMDSEFAFLSAHQLPLINSFLSFIEGTRELVCPFSFL